MSEAATTATVPRPQPLGVFPLPAGYLLIGEGEDHDELRRTLTAGKLPDGLPASLEFYQLALDGDLAAATASLTGDDAISAANRLVLDPSEDRFDIAFKAAADAGDQALKTFVETMGFIVGLAPRPPEPGDTDGEFAALVHAAQATLAMEQRDIGAAVESLEEAAKAADTVSKALAGQLLGQLANAQLDEGGTKRATVSFEAAIDALSDTDLPLSRAELHVAIGAMFQERSESAPRLMQQAIDHYHQAMALVTAETAPETFAIANANLGLAYLMMPMNEASDQLRIGVAVQSMREALRIFRPESHPDRWSSTQLNLANALVYMPSKHQAENIAEAVDLYQEVLDHREGDPLGRGRVLANQGNALAHLGHLSEARGLLSEARAIFVQHDETDSAAAVGSVLDEVSFTEQKNADQ